MKTAIVYVSTHHGNTKRLVDAIEAKREVTLIDGTAQNEEIEGAVEFFEGLEK